MPDDYGNLNDDLFELLNETGRTSLLGALFEHFVTVVVLARDASTDGTRAGLSDGASDALSAGIVGAPQRGLPMAKAIIADMPAADRSAIQHWANEAAYLYAQRALLVLASAERITNGERDEILDPRSVAVVAMAMAFDYPEDLPVEIKARWDAHGLKL